MARPATRASRPSASDRPSVRRPRALAVAQSSSAPSSPSVVQSPDKTVREVIPPWHVIQKKMVEKEAEKAAEKKEERAPLSTITPPPPAPEALLALSAFEDVAPPSGVRLSEPPLPVAEVADSDVVLAGNEEEPALSFKVYTLAELERRSDAPMAMSMRASRRLSVAFDGTLSRSSQHAVRVKNAVLTFARAALAWLRTSKMEREPAKIALRKPFDVMGDELEFVVRSIDWKKAGVYTGIAVGASLTLLFTVLTAAELTDDLHTNGKANMSFQSTSAVNPPPLAAAPLPPAPVVIAPPAAPAAAEETLEIDPPKKAATSSPAKKPAPAKKKLAYRNADDIFKP